MKVLLVGANGYIGSRLISFLLEKGHTVVCLVRDKRRFQKYNAFGQQVTLITGDLLKEQSIAHLPPDIDAAYYLVSSMAETVDFAQLEALSAHNFTHVLDKTNCRQTIFLSGIINDDKPDRRFQLHGHVEDVLREGKTALTILRAATIIGPGSTSFEIIRSLTGKLPILPVAGWVNAPCQPIWIGDVLAYLEGIALNPKAFNKTFDIGGPEILTFKQMMHVYAEARKLKRYMITIPFLSPKISSYWLHFVTSASYASAASLVNSMKKGS
ncbi:MAG TPA: NAD(P)H-binding protein, partial [Mucilaginibacter sp.]